MLKIAPESLPVDADGDIGIRSGSAMVFVRVRDEPPLVEVFSPVLTEVHENQRLYQRLSELTHRMPIGRLYWAGNTVWASVTAFGRDFQATHLMLAVQAMTGLADELDDPDWLVSSVVGGSSATHARRGQVGIRRVRHRPCASASTSDGTSNSRIYAGRHTRCPSFMPVGSRPVGLAFGCRWPS